MVHWKQAAQVIKSSNPGMYDKYDDALVISEQMKLDPEAAKEVDTTGLAPAVASAMSKINGPSVTKPKVTPYDLLKKESNPSKRDAILTTMMAQDQAEWNNRGDTDKGVSFRDFVHNKYNPDDKWNPVVGGARRVGEAVRNLLTTGSTRESMVPEGSQAYDVLMRVLGGDKTVAGNRLSEYEDAVTGGRTEGVGSERKMTAGGVARDLVGNFINPDELLTNAAGVALGAGAGAAAAKAAKGAGGLAKLAQLTQATRAGRLATNAAVNAATTGGAEYINSDDAGRAAQAGAMGAAFALPLDVGLDIHAQRNIARGAAEAAAKAEKARTQVSSDWMKARDLASTAHPIGSPERQKLLDSPMEPKFVADWIQSDAKGSRVADPNAIKRRASQAAQDPMVQEILSSRLTPEQMADPELVMAALDAEHLARNPRNPKAMSFEEAKLAHDAIPSPENHDAYFTGTPKQIADKFRAAKKAYDLLRANGEEADPRFEGKNLADMIAEHSTKIKSAGDDVTASALQGEVDRLVNRSAAAEMVKLGSMNERIHGAQGAAVDAFLKLPKEQQRHLLADFGTGDAATDEAVNSIAEGFGTSVDQLRSIASNKAVSDDQFADAVKVTAELSRKSMATSEIKPDAQSVSVSQEPIAAGEQPTGQTQDAVSQAASSYSAGDPSHKADILQAEIMDRPDIAESLGLKDAVKKVGHKNKAVAADGKNEIRKVAEQIATENPELPELFR